MTIYVENQKIAEQLPAHVINSAWCLQMHCIREGLHFEQDDMCNCYVSENEYCECFIALE